MASLTNGDKIELQLINGKFYYIDGNGQFTEFQTGAAASAVSYPEGTKIYRAWLTQSGTNAPVPTVLQNTLGGTPVWARSTTGIYTCTLANAFTDGKTIINFPQDRRTFSFVEGNWVLTDLDSFSGGSNFDNSSFFINTTSDPDESRAGTLADGVLGGTFDEAGLDYIEVIVLP
jgi:hypothetical protein